MHVWVGSDSITGEGRAELPPVCRRRTIEDFDFDFQPGVHRKLVEDLATLRFIEENQSILFLGQPGCGKTHLAVALAVVAAAILDRLMHNAIVFNIKGPSWRLREHNGLELAATNPNPNQAR